MAAAWLLPVINLANTALGLISDERAKVHINRIAKLKKEILEEESQGYMSDDAKVENLQDQLLIVIEAADNEIKLYTAKNS